MIKVEKLIEELGKFPANGRAYAYEGEIRGIVVVNKEDDELGYILANEDEIDFEEKAIIHKRKEVNKC